MKNKEKEVKNKEQEKTISQKPDEKNELEQKLKDLQEKLEESEKQVGEAKDRYQRLCAEFENYKKRTKREKEDLYIDSVADTIGAVLPVIDNFERALATETDNTQSVREGMEMIYRQLKDVLKDLGVEEIASVGEKFDPMLHNAVVHARKEDKEDNLILEEFQKGYKIKGKVIRHSMVEVVN